MCGLHSTCGPGERPATSQRPRRAHRYSHSTPEIPPRGAAARSRTQAPCTASHGGWRAGRGVRPGARRDDEDQDPRLRTHGAQAARRSASAASSLARRRVGVQCPILSSRVAVLRKDAIAFDVESSVDLDAHLTDFDPDELDLNHDEQAAAASATAHSPVRRTSGAAGCSDPDPATNPSPLCYLRRAANRRGTHAQSRRPTARDSGASRGSHARSTTFLDSLQPAGRRTRDGRLSGPRLGRHVASERRGCERRIPRVASP
jgi:hypothetical protein